MKKKKIKEWENGKIICQIPAYGGNKIQIVISNKQGIKQVWYEETLPKELNQFGQLYYTRKLTKEEL